MTKTYSAAARRRLESQLGELDRVFEKLTDSENRQEQVDNRRYAIACILESYGSWSEDGDCIPSLIKLGRFGDRWIKVSIVNGTEQEVSG